MNDIAQRTKKAFELYRKGFPHEIDIIERMNQGVNVHLIDDQDGWTLLHWAVVYNHKAVCELLLQQGADIDAQTTHGSTPLHRASVNGSSLMVDYLLERGASIHLHDNNGETPLHMAQFSENFQNIQPLLLEHGANIWAQNKKSIKPANNGGLQHSYSEEWQRKLGAVKGGNCDVIKTRHDLYHLASVMTPSNPKNVPPPEEFIRSLFQQHIPHESQFNRMYAEIFAQQRINAVENLQKLREAARKNSFARV